MVRMSSGWIVSRRVPGHGADPDIELRAENDRVMGLFGADNPVGRLADLVDDERMFSPPLAWLVDEIAETLMPFLVVAGQPAEGPEG